jgi:hypothetical protein
MVGDGPAGEQLLTVTGMPKPHYGGRWSTLEQITAHASIASA